MSVSKTFSLSVAYRKIMLCVLTHNRLPALRRLVQTLGPTLADRTVGLVVLDQNSSDGTLDYLRAESRVSGIGHTNENLGCAGGRQALVDALLRGLLESDDILIFIDDDCYVTDDGWLDGLTQPIRDGKADIVGVDGGVIDADGMSCPAGDRPVEFVGGGRMAVRAAVFERCAFDARYNPNYFEDADLCLQARLAGFRVRAVGDVGLAHDFHPGNAEHGDASRRAFLAKWGAQR